MSSTSWYHIQFSCSVISDSSWPHGPQHTRLPCPSPTPGVYSNSCPLSRWCHSTISSSVVPFCFCLQSFPASGSFQMSQFFTSGGQSIGSFSFSISLSKQFLVTKINLELRLSRTRSMIPAVLGTWQLLLTSRVFSRFIVCSHRGVGDVMWLDEGDNVNVCCFMQWSPLLIILCAPENT